MAEKDKLFESKVKNTGIIDFPEFYRFCYDWLVDEIGLDVSESKYVEKILPGDSKNVDIQWEGYRKATDYFKYKIEVSFRILGLKKVEIQQNEIKKKTNEGNVEVKVVGTLIRDFQGKYEHSAFGKFMRGVYEKWIIPSKIIEYEDKLIGECDEFLSQAKAFMDLEGKR